MRGFYVPGVIASIVTLITLMLTSMAIVQEKEIGTMEQIIVTPITPFEFILGKTVSFALIGFADVVLVTVVGVFWFAVPIRGSLLLLFFATTLYLMTTLGIGLLISTLSRTQQQAMMTTFFFFMPAILLSGLMFPIANMPDPVQMAHLFESDALLLGDHPGYLPQGGGISHSLVPDGGPGRNGPFHFMVLLEEIPQDPRLIIGYGEDSILPLSESGVQKGEWETPSWPKGKTQQNNFQSCQFMLISPTG